MVDAAHARRNCATAIAAACEPAHVETALVALMQAETIEPGSATLCVDADRLAEALGLDTAAEIVAAIEELEDGDRAVYGPLLRLAVADQP